MKILSGSELVGFIKERQAKQVRNLKQAHHVNPKLAIVRCGQAGNTVIATYVRLKQRYGDDIGVEVVVYDEDASTVRERITALNEASDVHGIIVQLPIEPEAQTDELLALISPQKDVDGLTADSPFDAATPMAINWLLAGYGVTLQKVGIVGRGRLVGAPLERMLRNSGVDVATYVLESEGTLVDFLADKPVIISATGQPNLITSDMIPTGAVVVDAGTASEDGVLFGDVSEDARQRDDLTITPVKGGVGPLTVATLFDNTLRAARAQATQQDNS